MIDQNRIRSFLSNQKSFSPDLSDGELLRRFSAHQEDSAFEELVQRYGSLVLGVCRRVLQHEQDTEDAFQATFLVLARKARSIQKYQSLGSWLYKVAYRIALRSRAQNQKRKTKENEARHHFEETVCSTQDERVHWLDEEVQRLPEKYRAPVLMCYLQGQTNEEAARQLCCPTGTVKIRLMRARELLRKRLLRRGIGTALGVVLAGWSCSAQAVCPPPLKNATLKGGRALLTEQSLSGLNLSPGVLRLVRGWFKRAALARLKLSSALLLTAILLVLTDRLPQQAWSAPRQKQPSLPCPTQQMEPAPEKKKPDSPLPGNREMIVSQPPMRLCLK